MPKFSAVTTKAETLKLAAEIYAYLIDHRMQGQEFRREFGVSTGTYQRIRIGRPIFVLTAQKIREKMKGEIK